jgi:Double zinc ribbon
MRETMVTCASCGNEEPEGSRFCGNCGAPFAPAEQEPSGIATGGERMSTCASCGNEEPEGSRFCGNCGAPFSPVGQQPAEAAATVAREPADTAPATEIPTPEPAGGPPPRVEPSATSPAEGGGRLRWIAAGAAVALLVSGGAIAALLSLTGGEGSTQVIPTTQQTPLDSTSDSQPPEPSSTLADMIGPRLQEIAVSQATVSTQVSSLRAGDESFATLRAAARALATRVLRTQQLADGLAPNDAAEARTLVLLRRALAAHLAYAEALANLPARPRLLTETSAQAAIARAELARRAYADLGVADSTLPMIYITRSDHASLLAVVPVPVQPPRAAGRVVDLVPLLVGRGPDDPLGRGRCFGPYSSRASLRISGVTHRTSFIQCGDSASGDPSRVNGVYAFAGPTFPGQARLVRMTGQVAIDESSAPSQRGSSVTWTVSYNGAPICSSTVVWSGPRPLPRRLDCKIPAAASSAGLDVRRLEIQQVASLTSAGSMWAGLLDPKIVVDPL